MSGKEGKPEGFHAKCRCNLNDISYLSETQKKLPWVQNYSCFVMRGTL